MTPDPRPAPRTWFSRPPQPAGLDPDSQAFLTLGAVMILTAAPLTVLVALAVYGLGRLVRLRWWLPLVAAVPAGLAATLGWGAPAALAARYVAGYRHLWAATGDNAAHLPTAVAHGWRPLLGALAPLSVPVGLVAAGLALGYAELRRPAWRNHSRGRGSGRRAAKTRRTIERTTTVIDQAGRFPLGVEVGSGAAVTLAEADLAAHAFLAGASGSGKTTGLVRLAAAAVEWGRPVIFIDLKGDPTVVAHLQAIAEQAGVACFAWTLDGGASWDPLAHGDPSQLKDKLVGLEEWGDPHYKLAASRFVQLVFAATLAAGVRPSLADVVALLDPKKVSAAARSWPAGAGDALLAYADSLTPDQRSGVAGLATRLGVLTESTAGPYLVPGPDAIDLAELVTSGAGGIVVFSLDSGRWPEVARQVATLVVQDLRAVCGAALQRQPRPAWTVIVDEFSALDATHLLGLFARGRAAGCSVILSTQELADLDTAGAGFRDQVLGNTALKMAFRQDLPASAELWAAMVGTEAAWVETIQTAHRSGGPLAPTVGQATGTGSLRSVERFVWHPNTIKRLPQGRCLLITKHPAFSARLCDVVIPTPGKAAAA